MTRAMATTQPYDVPPADILAALRRMGLLDGSDPAGARLTGGVSSDIWRIDLPSGPICVKRALPKLRVAADWQAPVERNMFEARWMRAAGRTEPTAVPAVLGQDAAAGLLAMRYLPPERYPVWKAILRQGTADPAFAAQVAKAIGRIHAATAGDPSLARDFATDRIFWDIRLEPYLIAAAKVHAPVADRLRHLAEVTAGNRFALVHGDVSPKNILAGPDGPVLLDAECAWWGDPAFDLTFCLNHLLLKCLWVPAATGDLLRCFPAWMASRRSSTSPPTLSATSCAALRCACWPTRPIALP
jgi:aminoglycoside phosphotransferase (APT) family kinase protein